MKKSLHRFATIAVFRQKELEPEFYDREKDLRELETDIRMLHESMNRRQHTSE